MASSMTEEQIYALAKKRAEAKRGFLVHLTVYLGVNTVLVLVWAFAAGGGFPWFIFPILGWGIGVLSHFLGAFGPDRKSEGSGSAAIEKEAERIRREQG